MGAGRKANEDRYLISPKDDGSLLLAVADGMGIENGGALIADQLMEQLDRFQASNQILQRLSALLAEIDKAVCHTVQNGAGATCTAVLLRHGYAYIAHVGDSRLYLLRRRKLTQITQDQNMAQFLVEEGKITALEARNHKARHLLDQCVGCGDCRPEQFLMQIRPGDKLLLTTDGVHNSISIETMTKILNNRMTLSKTVRLLLDTSRRTGSQDDRTALLTRIPLL